MNHTDAVVIVPDYGQKVLQPHHEMGIVRNMSEHSVKAYVTTREIAERLGVSTQMVLIYAKRLGLVGQVKRVGRAYLFPSEMADTIVRRPPGRPRREY